MLGDEACGADLSAFHPLMFLSTHPRTAALLEPCRRVREWMGRVRAIGHGKREEIDAAEAIRIARDAEPAAFDGEPVLPDGIALGTPVVVLPDEYGSGNVAGTLAPSGVHEIAVRRRTERAGEVVVHFPREDYSRGGDGLAVMRVEPVRPRDLRRAGQGRASAPWLARGSAALRDSGGTERGRQAGFPAALYFRSSAPLALRVTWGRDAGASMTEGRWQRSHGGRRSRDRSPAASWASAPGSSRGAPTPSAARRRGSACAGAC